jgi:hypothetical protein
LQIIETEWYSDAHIIRQWGLEKQLGSKALKTQVIEHLSYFNDSLHNTMVYLKANPDSLGHLYSSVALGYSFHVDVQGKVMPLCVHGRDSCRTNLHFDCCIPTNVTRSERFPLPHSQIEDATLNRILSITMVYLRHILFVSSLTSAVLGCTSQSGLDGELQIRSTEENGLSTSPQSIFIPWTAPFSRSPAYTPSVRGSISGRTYSFPVDTSTTGVLIGSSLLPSVKLTTQDPPGWEFIESNSILYSGKFVQLNITFSGTSKSQQATSRVPVLVVTQAVKCPGYDASKDNGTCPKTKLVPRWSQRLNTVLYMGVGFGRNIPGSGLPYGSPSSNPFLNIISLGPSKPLSWRIGYTLSTRGVQLGLTANNTAGAAWIQLQKMASLDPRAWALPLLSFTHDNSSTVVQAEALVDTSITQMYIQTTPQLPLPNNTVRDPGSPSKSLQLVKPGTRLVFAFPDFKSGVAGYDFVVGDTKFPSQPRFVGLVDQGKGAFVNTGRNFLFGFSVVYDAVAGKFGLICDKCV